MVAQPKIIGPVIGADGNGVAAAIVGAVVVACRRRARTVGYSSVLLFHDLFRRKRKRLNSSRFAGSVADSLIRHSCWRQSGASPNFVGKALPVGYTIAAALRRVEHFFFVFLTSQGITPGWRKGETRSKR
jgi:hypothetical protein